MSTKNFHHAFYNGKIEFVAILHRSYEDLFSHSIVESHVGVMVKHSAIVQGEIGVLLGEEEGVGPPRELSPESILP